MLNKQATVGLLVAFTLSDEIARTGKISRLLAATTPEGTDREVEVSNINPPIEGEPIITIACDELGAVPTGLKNNQVSVGMRVYFVRDDVKRQGTAYQLGPETTPDGGDRQVSLKDIQPAIPGTPTVNVECSDLTLE